MLCSVCKQNPATVHLTEVVGEQLQQTDLCEECGCRDFRISKSDWAKPIGTQGVDIPIQFSTRLANGGKIGYLN